MAKKPSVDAGSATKPAQSAKSARPTRREQPVILIRGFGGLSVEDEKRIAYQGFNDGTVYPQKRGENYIYEGLILRFMKSRWQYQDATNIVGYFGSPVAKAPPDKDIPEELKGFDPKFFYGDKVVIDPAMAVKLVNSSVPLKSLWVFRYYDLEDRKFEAYGEALVRLIKFIRALTKRKGQEETKVNILAHSMGGLIVREAVQKIFPRNGESAPDFINKIVTLGTPHKGISFQILRDWIRIEAQEELERFNPNDQKDGKKDYSFLNFAKHFPPERILTVVGTNYRTYGPVVATLLNRLFSVAGEFGTNYNRSDGLVKQENAQLPKAPRTFVHKCHGGPDSLVTSREAFEIATRFFFGNIRVSLRLTNAKVKRGFDWFGKSEFFFGVSVKPRRVDFDLFHQSAEAENCYGPFSEADFSDPNPAFNWANDERGLIWEGWLDTAGLTLGTDAAKPEDQACDVVLRLDVYVGERDLLGVGFSDNLVFRKQYYVRAVFDNIDKLKLHALEMYTGENFDGNPDVKSRQVERGTWEFDINGTGFEGTLQASLGTIPENG